MKIELKKEPAPDLRDLYCIYIDGVFITAFFSLEEALKSYEAIKSREKKSKVEIIKSEEI